MKKSYGTTVPGVPQGCSGPIRSGPVSHTITLRDSLSASQLRALAHHGIWLALAFQSERHLGVDPVARYPVVLDLRLKLLNVDGADAAQGFCCLFYCVLCSLFPTVRGAGTPEGHRPR